MIFCPLFSSSSGNASYISTEKGSLLIDAGLAGRNIIEAICSIGEDPSRLKGICVTHEHTDHIRGVGVLSRKFDIPIYANEATWARMERKIGAIPSYNQKIFTRNSFLCNDIEITPFSISHDAADPVGFTVSTKKYRIATVTDLGIFTDTVYEAIKGSDIVLLESNHDPQMLQNNENYPDDLKVRIHGEKGHLSNEESGRAAVSLAKSGVKHFILGHLSKENNETLLARGVVKESLKRANIIVDKDVFVEVAHKTRVSNVYTLENGV